jgi:hypothetical protein
MHGFVILQHEKVRIQIQIHDSDPDSDPGLSRKNAFLVYTYCSFVLYKSSTSSMDSHP